jgi:hypothetical protein
MFGQGFLPLALDKSISNCRAAVLVLVHPGYFISPMPTISGEHSPLHHLGRQPMGDWQQAAMTTKNLEPDQWRNRVWFLEDSDSC